ncbi:uncharacterized protein N7443_007108 [Penicillium atrosanguineum]|uniref:uncharacterized protein n=1 Tax=Penicillium atrosanguineum TaxID=1132637 RepID=UPI0023A17BEF|nr:uncharacterized protein N7443_007108 [Penicillium atrosanguineum]KAJ5296215.1 hypothetical protein N7443_007108 [Penicillium atrosanguineum]
MERLELLVAGARPERLAGRVRQDPVSSDPRILEPPAPGPGLPHAVRLRDDSVTLSVEDPVGHFDIGLLREVKVVFENPTLKDRPNPRYGQRNVARLGGGDLSRVKGLGGLAMGKVPEDFLAEGSKTKVAQKLKEQRRSIEIEMMLAEVKERVGALGSGERNRVQATLLEDRIHRHQDGAGDSIFLAGAIGARPTALEGGIAALLGVDVRANQGQRGVTDSATNMLLRAEHTRVDRKSIKPWICERIDISRGENFLGRVVKLAVEQASFPEGATSEGRNARSVTVGSASVGSSPGDDSSGESSSAFLAGSGESRRGSDTARAEDLSDRDPDAAALWANWREKLSRQQRR